MPRINLKKHRKPGSIDDARLLQWRALKAAEEALYAAGEEDDGAAVLKAVHAVTQGTAGYAKLVEASELEQRLATVEQALERRQRTPAPTYAAAHA